MKPSKLSIIGSVAWLVMIVVLWALTLSGCGTLPAPDAKPGTEVATAHYGLPIPCWEVLDDDPNTIIIECSDGTWSIRSTRFPTDVVVTGEDWDWSWPWPESWND